MQPETDVLTSLAIGLCLAAACGFRVFVPLLVMSVAARWGMLPLAEGFEWLASYPAMVAFAAATAMEVVAYLIPLVDNALDALAAPVAIIAGAVAMAATIADMDPLLAWSVAIVAGGGAAGVVQGTTTVGRAASTVTTGGSGNFLLSAVEFVGSMVMAVVALVLPLLGALLVLLFVCVAAVRLGKRFLRRGTVS